MVKYFLIRALLLLLLIGNSILSYSQLKGDYNWQLGSSSLSPITPYAVSIELKFNDQKITVDTFFRSMDMDFFNSSISDDDGNLLLYSNGCQIRDGHHKYIQGTNFLSPGSINDEWCIQNHIGYPVPEGGLFLPFFKDSIIFLLHQRLNLEYPPINYYIDVLFYSSVLKTGDTYTLIEKTIPLLKNDEFANGNVEAVKANGPESWWVIQAKRKSNTYYTIRLDSARVDTVFKQSIGDITQVRDEASGQSVFSTSGNMFARYSPKDDLFLFDFNRTTGLLSNYRKFHVADSGSFGGLAFSPNNRFLYVCTKLDMYQFDLWDKDIQRSKVHLGHFDGYFDPLPATFYHMQLGPDCRIYIIPPNGISVMHVINNPDIKGLDCGFEQHGFHFPVSNSITLPNFPNYRLGYASACDYNIVSGFWEFKFGMAPVNIYPNPTFGFLSIELGDQWLNEERVDIHLVDQFARECFAGHFNAFEKNRTISIEGLSPGFYFLTVKSKKKWFTAKISKL